MLINLKWGNLTEEVVIETKKLMKESHNVENLKDFK